MALVTIWFLTAEQPLAALDHRPQPDRGFARKYLAHLNPRWPLTHIGDFDITRSTPPGPSEFYIGSFRGFSVVHTELPQLLRASDLDPHYFGPIPADDIYVTVVSEGVSRESVSFAHWAEDRLVRGFTAQRLLPTKDSVTPGEQPHPTGSLTVLEDKGARESWEADWSTQPELLTVSFLETAWLGLPATPATHVHTATPRDQRDLPVAAFATDGRPETKRAEPQPAPSSLTPVAGGYDDYATGITAREEPDTPSAMDAIMSRAQAVRGVLGRLAVNQRFRWFKG